MKIKLVLLLAVATAFVTFTKVYAQKSESYPFSFKVSGQGEKSIVFIPGFACSGDVWNETLAVFEKDFTCYTLTMAGFAGQPPMSDPTFTGWEKGIAEFIKSKQIKNPIVIGHSMGGVMAMALAADYPDLIGKIVVVDALPCLAALRNPSFASAADPDCSAMVDKFDKMSDEQFYQMQKQSIPQLLADTTEQETVIGWSMKSDRRTFAKMYCDFSNTDLREKIKSINCPNLILLEPFFMNIKLAIDTQFKNFQNANLQFATKGLHFIMFDDRVWYFSQLKNFLNSK